MPLIDIKVPDSFQYVSAASLLAVALDQTTDYMFATAYADKSGSISHVGFNFTAKSGSPPTFRVGIQGVSGTREVDNVWKGAAGSGYAEVVNPALGWTWIALSGNVPVTGGTPINIVCRYHTGTVNSANSLFVARNMTMVNTSLTPYVSHNNNGTLTNTTALPTVAYRYTDGTVGPRGVIPISGISAPSYTSGSNPIYKGNCWIPSFDCECRGVMCYIRTSTVAADFLIKVFKDNESSPLVSLLVDANYNMGSLSASALGYFNFPSLILASGSLYRFVLQPITSTALSNYYEITVPDRESMKSAFGDLFGTVGTSGAPPTWTNHTGGSPGFKYFQIHPVITSVLIGYTGQISSSSNSKGYAL